MASQVSPGISVRERDLTSSVVTGVQQITGALASSFKKGPIEEVVGINSQKELVEVFGKPVDANAEDWFVASEFLQYGGRLAIVRAATNVLNAAPASGTATLVKNELDWQGGTGASNDFIARSAGTWANSLAVVVADRGADQVVTIAATPAGGISAGDSVTFTTADGQKSGVVYSYTMATRELAVVLDDPTSLLTTSAVLDDPDSVGEVTGAQTVTAGGSGYTNGATVTTTATSGSGDNALTLQLTTVDGVLSGTGAIDAAGTGYVAGQTYDVLGGVGGEVLVDSVGANGEILTFSVAAGGSGYTAGPLLIENATTQATLQFTTSNGVITDATAVAGGTGYAIGDTVTVSGGVGGEVTIAAIVNDTTVISAVKDWWSNYEIGSTGLTLSAIGPRPGTSIYASNLGLKYDEIHVAVIDVDGKISGSPGNVVERLTYLSKLTDGKGTEGGQRYYKTIINEQSRYIFAGATQTYTSAPSTAGAGVAWAQSSEDLTSGDAFTLVNQAGTEEGYVRLEGGTDDYAYDASEISSAYDFFASSEDQQVDFILMGGSMALESDTKTKAAKVVAIASSRQDALGFVSPHKGNQIGSGGGALSSNDQKLNTIAFFSNIQSTSYAVFDSGYKYLYDRFNDKYRYVPCNGDIAGLCVSTSAQLDDWYSPAGLTRGSLRNAVKLAYNPGKADRDELYQARINPVTSFPGSGVALFGDKTALAAPSAFDRINVRRLFINIRKRSERLANAVLFEQNDATTRAGFAGALNAYLGEVQSRRGVTDFLVVCDESNNTPDVIDRNEFVAEVFIKPTRSINYVTVTLTATKTGVSFSEVIGSAN
jgi:hypothetical protein